MNNGYILIWRQLQNSSFYKDSYAVHLAVHLILKVNHQPSKIIFNKQEITVDKGQCITGRFSLSSETGINPSTIREKLTLLKNVGFLDIKSTNKFSLITLIKYSLFQESNKKMTALMTTKCQQNDNKMTQTIQIKHLIQDQDIYILAFKKLWECYPNKDGRKAAERHFNVTVKTPEQIIQINKALDNYLQHLQKEEWKRPKNGSTWFNNWKDWIVNPITEIKAQEKPCGFK